MWPEDYTSPQGDNRHPEEELAAFALNALDDAEFQAVFHHVVQCPHCQEVLLGFREASARLTASAPLTPLPDRVKGRVLDAAVGRKPEPPRNLPPADPRWSGNRLRKWLTPALVGTLSLLLAVSIGVMALQQREIDRLADAAMGSERELAATASALQMVAQGRDTVEAGTVPGSLDAGNGGLASPAMPNAVAASMAGTGHLDRGTPDLSAETADSRAAGDDAVVEPEEVVKMKQEMAEVVEATVLSAQPETEKVTMSSPMGTEPEAKGILMMEPNGLRGVLMVSGMPADSYQIWLSRHDKREMVGRIVVNDDDGSGVEQLELHESIFGYRELSLMPDERHGPTNPTGETFLSARIIGGPPVPPLIWRGR